MSPATKATFSSLLLYALFACLSAAQVLASVAQASVAQAGVQHAGVQQVITRTGRAGPWPAQRAGRPIEVVKRVMCHAGESWSRAG